MHASLIAFRSEQHFFHCYRAAILLLVCRNIVNITTENKDSSNSYQHFPQLCQQFVRKNWLKLKSIWQQAK